ncbi:MAG: RNase H family protein [Candidatus Woesearchaeota archaeon]
MTQLAAYVDGSYSKRKKMYSYGIVLIELGKVIKKISKTGKNKEAAKMHQIYGELKGAMDAIDYAIENSYDKITIFYDYMGIEMWAKGKWKRNKKYTKKYYEFIQERKDKIDINFIKVKAHSNNKFNDLADELAKEAL